jgi:hypothetical protein
MSESTLLIAASASMLAVSFLVAGLFWWLNAPPVWVITAGTMAGIIVYASFWLVGGRLVRNELVVEEEENV